jgi:hypothetical protein
VASRRRGPKAIGATLGLERHNILVLFGAGALATAAAIGLADMAGYRQLADAVQDVVPVWFAICFAGEVAAYLGYVLAVRAVALVDGGPVLSLRLSMRTVVAGFGVFAATHAAGGFAVDYWTLRAPAFAGGRLSRGCSRSERLSTPSSPRPRSSARSSFCSVQAKVLVRP